MNSKCENSRDNFFFFVFIDLLIMPKSFSSSITLRDIFLEGSYWALINECKRDTKYKFPLHGSVVCRLSFSLIFICTSLGKLHKSFKNMAYNRMWSGCWGRFSVDIRSGLRGHVKKLLLIYIKYKTESKIDLTIHT